MFILIIMLYKHCILYIFFSINQLLIRCLYWKKWIKKIWITAYPINLRNLQPMFKLVYVLFIFIKFQITFLKYCLCVWNKNDKNLFIFFIKRISKKCKNKFNFILKNNFYIILNSDKRKTFFKYKILIFKDFERLKYISLKGLKKLSDE